jgi:hypothetical protein
MAAQSLRCVRNRNRAFGHFSTIRPSSWIAAAGGVLGSLEVRDDLARFRDLYPPRSPLKAR